MKYKWKDSLYNITVRNPENKNTFEQGKSTITLKSKMAAVTEIIRTGLRSSIAMAIAAIGESFSNVRERISGVPE